MSLDIAHLEPAYIEEIEKREWHSEPPVSPAAKLPPEHVWTSQDEEDHRVAQLMAPLSPQHDYPHTDSDSFLKLFQESESSVAAAGTATATSTASRRLLTVSGSEEAPKTPPPLLTAVAYDVEEDTKAEVVSRALNDAISPRASSSSDAWSESSVAPDSSPIHRAETIGAPVTPDIQDNECRTPGNTPEKRELQRSPASSSSRASEDEKENMPTAEAPDRKKVGRKRPKWKQQEEETERKKQSNKAADDDEKEEEEEEQQDESIPSPPKKLRKRSERILEISSRHNVLPLPELPPMPPMPPMPSTVTKRKYVRRKPLTTSKEEKAIDATKPVDAAAVASPQESKLGVTASPRKETVLNRLSVSQLGMIASTGREPPSILRHSSPFRKIWTELSVAAKAPATAAAAAALVPEPPAVVAAASTATSPLPTSLPPLIPLPPSPPRRPPNPVPTSRLPPPPKEIGQIFYRWSLGMENEIRFHGFPPAELVSSLDAGRFHLLPNNGGIYYRFAF